MTGTDNQSKEHYLCSELVKLRWNSEFGVEREVDANLEEIRASGATLQCDFPVRAKTRLRIQTSGMALSGTVTSSSADFIGHFVEVRFDEGCRWSREEYEPAHLLDPNSLLPANRLKQKNNQLLAECFRLLEIGTGPRKPPRSASRDA